MKFTNLTVDDTIDLSYKILDTITDSDECIAKDLLHFLKDPDIKEFVSMTKDRTIRLYKEIKS